MSIEVSIIKADYSDTNHRNWIVELTNDYARDPMGGGKDLPKDVQEHLIEGLASMPTAFTMIALKDGKPAGLANCVIGFSTFLAAKLVNIHDLAVLPTFRGLGIGQILISAVEKEAIHMGCKKLTLEVREDNAAKRLYERMGFEYGEPKMFFMNKKIG